MAQKRRKAPVVKAVAASTAEPDGYDEAARLPDHSAADRSAADRSAAALWAAFAVLTIDALGTLAGGIYFAVRSTGHDATNQKAAVTQAVFLLLAALIFGVLARGALPRRPMPGIRTPSMILEIIFIPVAIGLFQSGRPGIGAPLLLSALIAIAGLVLGFRRGNTTP